MNYLEQLYLESTNKKNYFAGYYNYLHKLCNKLDSSAIEEVINCFMTARENEKTIFFAGNGGSASTASHFALDLGEVGRKANVKSFKTTSLADNVSFLTAVGNDYGYEKIFSVQLAEMFGEGDVLVVISASGNSPNVLEAVKYAKKKGGITVGLVGFDGGTLLKLCDHIIHVKANLGEYGPVEDIHMILDHMITSLLVFKLKLK